MKKTNPNLTSKRENLMDSHVSPAGIQWIMLSGLGQFSQALNDKINQFSECTKEINKLETDLAKFYK